MRSQLQSYLNFEGVTTYPLFLVVILMVLLKKPSVYV